ncbi:MAG: S41 family peptidase [Vicinamibacteria bacterium]|nr:S41 family peptidase [Vicinamibacteria bacterium]
MRISRLTTLCLGILAASTLAGGLFGERALAGTTQLSERLRLYTALLGAIEENYAEEVPTDRLVSASVREMLRTLDPHSNFLEVKEYSSLQEKQRGSYYGLGITVQSIDGGITVVAIFEGTPAHRLGLRTGDVIARIEGQDARGISIDDAVKRLRGPKGSPVQITIERKGYDAPLEFTVLRDEIPLHSVPYAFMATPKTGYVRLIDFNETTACRSGEPADCERELERALKALIKQGATSVVLDIRDNPGGLLDQAFAVSNLFLRKGQLVVFTKGRYKRDEATFITERDSAFADLPLVVLVSRHSASASEIVAGAIQDHDRGLIVGETTFGKGLVQTILPLRSSRGYALALTTARYYTPSGRLIQRDYGHTALEDYVSPREREACRESGEDARLTDAGRKVYGGDGITPDYCVERETLPKPVAALVGRQAFVGFARTFEPAESAGQAKIEGAGSRNDAGISTLKPIRRDFSVDATVLEDFRRHLGEQKIPLADDEFAAHRELISRILFEEILRQVWGDAEARRRTLAWDVQLQKALELVPRAELLLKDPQGFVAAREAELRVARAAGR